MQTINKFRVIVTVALFLLTIVSTAQAKYSGGTGEPNDPYQIATAEDLMLLGESTEDYDKHFILTADIDLDPNLPGRKVFDRAVIAPDMNDVKDGFQGIPFTGIFNGNSHMVSNLKIVGRYSLGLFGVLESGSEIKSLGLWDVNVTGSGYYSCGGLIAFNKGRITGCYSTGTVGTMGVYEGIGGLVANNAGTVTYCHSTATVRGHSAVGGLVGFNRGEVGHCFSTGAVSGRFSYTGGLVGSNTGSVIDCYSKGAVSGQWNVGGLVGWNSGSLTHCYSTGVVSSNHGEYTGGLTGFNDLGSITQCYSTGVVNGIGSWYVGGLLGRNLGTVSQCYSNGMVSGFSGVGGLAGVSDDGDLIQCYSTGAVSGNHVVGGLVGGTCRNVWSCFWDVETSGRTGSGGGIGKTTAEMKDIQNYLDVRWDFVGEIENGTQEAWQMPEGGGYPSLAVFNGYVPPQLQGAGTSEEPYTISDALELGAVIHYSPNAHYRLAASIDLSGVCFATAPFPWFQGTFEGSGHTITNLKIEGGSWLGVFGRLTSGAEIMNLGVVDANVAGSGSYIGVIVGSNGDPSRGIQGGVITRCYSTGVIQGSGRCSGGLIGLNNGNMIQCYSTAEVTGSRYVGGLTGSSTGALVADCYSTGSVTGTGDFVGGLIGSADGVIINCFSTGIVFGMGDYIGGLAGTAGDVTACFWDIQTSGQAKSGIGIGKTTPEMKTCSTFLAWGACGHEGVWTIDEGNDHPRLQWENRPGEPIRLPMLSDVLPGNGTENDPFLIHTYEELEKVGLYACEWDKHFKLMADIDLDPALPGRKVFEKAVIAACESSEPTWRRSFHGTPFTGVFDGDGHIISNLVITGQNYLGLFGQLGSGAAVRNLGVVHVNIDGSGDYIGSLAGHNRGTVTQCFSSGMVSGDQLIGGLVGANYGSIVLSYSNSEVNGNNTVGGLVGINGISVNEFPRASRFGVITDCYARGVVHGDEAVGGLVGLSPFGDVSRCFWDIETSGQPISDGGTGKTTAGMQTATTFLEVGWDFVGETANGTEDIWWILEGQDYPRLWWELIPEN